MSTELLRMLPTLDAGSTYYEPFVGGASVFLRLAPRRAVIGDANPALMDLYRHVKRSPDLVSRYLSELKRDTGERGYARARSAFNAAPNGARRAALFLYLNRTCFNGIWRVNRDGGFNVPFGKLDNPILPSRQHLRDVSRILRRARLMSGDFEKTLKSARDGDTVFLDPPYPPLNGTAFFTHYTKERFGDEDQERVAQVFRDLDSRGCRVMMSNADSSDMRSMYRGYAFLEISATRFVAAHGRRYGVKDVVVKNF